MDICTVCAKTIGRYINCILCLTVTVVSVAIVLQWSKNSSFSLLTSSSAIIKGSVIVHSDLLCFASAEASFLRGYLHCPHKHLQCAKLLKYWQTFTLYIYTCTAMKSELTRRQEPSNLMSGKNYKSCESSIALLKVPIGFKINMV